MESQPAPPAQGVRSGPAPLGPATPAACFCLESSFGDSVSSFTRVELGPAGPSTSRAVRAETPGGLRSTPRPHNVTVQVHGLVRAHHPASRSGALGETSDTSEDFLRGL